MSQTSDQQRFTISEVAAKARMSSKMAAFRRTAVRGWRFNVADVLVKLHQIRSHTFLLYDRFKFHQPYVVAQGGYVIVRPDINCCTRGGGGSGRKCFDDRSPVVHIYQYMKCMLQVCVTSSWSVLHSSAFLPQSKVYSVQTRLVSGKAEALVIRLLPSPLSSKMDPTRT